MGLERDGSTVQDSSVVFTVNLSWLDLSLARLLLNKRMQVFCFSNFTCLAHCSFKMAHIMILVKSNFR